MFLAFVGGAAAIHFDVFPGDQLRRAFSGGAALHERLTRYNDSVSTDFWADARTTARGVVRYDAARAQNGLTLYTSAHEQAAYLIDMEGNVVHRWALAFSKVWDESAAVAHPRPDAFIYMEKARVLPNGDLIALYTAIGDTPWGYGIVKMDSKSRVIWKYLHHAHHDFEVDGSGNVYVLTQQISEADLEGFAHLPKPRIDDFLVKLSSNGQELSSSWLTGVFASSPFGRRLHFSSQEAIRKGDYLHANSVDVLKAPVPGIPRSRAGQVLVSLREISTIAVIDLERGEVVWAQSGPWVRQHDAQILPNGNAIVFDNEGDTSGHGLSRVIEFEPATSRLVWRYGGTASEPLESTERSSETRLANGNTLVVESMAGRVIEVARNGDIVWEFVNPVRGGDGDRRIPIIFWVQRIDPDGYFDSAFKAQLSN